MLNYSFIIPHHNSPALLNRCLGSIPQREDIEIIVVDDNSDADKKPQVTRTDVKIVYIDAEHTKGAGKARNEALLIASGKWLVFADADDFFSDGFLAILDDYKDKEIEVLYFNSGSVDSQTLLPNERLKWEWSIFEKCNDQEKIIIKYNFHAPWYKMVRRRFIESYGIFFEEVPKGNDVLFTYLVASLSKNVEFDKRKAYVHTYNPNSITFRHYCTNDYVKFYTNYRKASLFFQYMHIDYSLIPLWRYCIRVLRKEGLLEMLQFVTTYFKKMNDIENVEKEYINEYLKCLRNKN